MHALISHFLGVAAAKLRSQAAKRACVVISGSTAFSSFAPLCVPLGPNHVGLESSACPTYIELSSGLPFGGSAGVAPSCRLCVALARRWGAELQTVC